MQENALADWSRGLKDAIQERTHSRIRIRTRTHIRIRTRIRIRTSIRIQIRGRIHGTLVKHMQKNALADWSRGVKDAIQKRTRPQNTLETLVRARDHYLKTLTDSPGSHIIGHGTLVKHMQKNALTDWSRGVKDAIQKRTRPQNTLETLVRARDHYLKTLTDSPGSHIIGHGTLVKHMQKNALTDWSRGVKDAIQKRTQTQNTLETPTRARDHHLKTLTVSPGSHIIGRRSHCSNFL